VAETAHEADTRRYATGVHPTDAEWLRAEQVWADADRALTAAPMPSIPQPVRDAVHTLGGLVSIWQGYGEDDDD